MKCANCFLILAVLIVVLSVWAGTAGSMFEEPSNFLIGEANPGLAHIGVVEVVVTPSGDQRITDAVFWKALAAKVEERLKIAGLKIPDPNQAGRRSVPFDTPKFFVSVDVRLFDGEQMFFSVRTLLGRPVYIAVRDNGSEHLKPGRMVKAAVWTYASAIYPATTKNLQESITDIALQETDVFVAAWAASNPPEREGSDTNAAVIEKAQTKKPVNSTAGEYPYVASKNSKVFHLPGCRSVKRISPENLTGYKSRAEAVSAGKRPCKLCKP